MDAAAVAVALAARPASRWAGRRVRWRSSRSRTLGCTGGAGGSTRRLGRVSRRRGRLRADAWSRSRAAAVWGYAPRRTSTAASAGVALHRAAGPTLGRRPGQLCHARRRAFDQRVSERMGPATRPGAKLPRRALYRPRTCTSGAVTRTPSSCGSSVSRSMLSRSSTACGLWRWCDCACARLDEPALLSIASLRRSDRPGLGRPRQREPAPSARARRGRVGGWANGGAAIARRPTWEPAIAFSLERANGCSSGRRGPGHIWPSGRPRPASTRSTPCLRWRLDVHRATAGGDLVVSTSRSPLVASRCHLVRRPARCGRW